MFELEILGYDLSICKLSMPVTDVSPAVNFDGDFYFFQKTPDEISLVCEAQSVPPNAVAVEAGWKALRVSGVLDFGLIGVLADITAVLAKAEIGVFVVSTYNTDYILLKSGALQTGVDALKSGGYTIK